MKKYKTIVVGTGFMGRTHGRNLDGCDALELTAWVGRHQPDFSRNSGNIATGSISAAAARKPFFDRLESCLEQMRPEAAIVCVPTVSHLELTRTCLEHGCHVMLEKPIALDEEESGRVIALAEAEKRIFMVAHCVRFTPEYCYLADRIRDRSMGRLEYLQLNRICARPQWGNWNDAHVSANSGGALYDLLIHDVDFARSTLGEPVKMELSSELRSCRGGDLIDSVWRYEDGAVVHLTGGHLRGTHYPFHCGYTAVFEHGTFYYSSEQPGLFAANGERIDFSSEPDGYRKELMYFNECVKTSQPPVLSSAADALRAVTLCRRMLHGGVPGTFRAGAAPLLR